MAKRIFQFQRSTVSRTNCKRSVCNWKIESNKRDELSKNGYKSILLKADLGVIWDLPELGRHLVEILADVPVPAPVQLRLVLDQAQPKVIRSETKFKDFKLSLRIGF